MPVILFIAPNPHKVKKREGFLQRVAAVDELFVDYNKRYYDDIDNDLDRAEALEEADLIYVHSIYSAKHILVTYPFLTDKIITDLHGTVPEEETFSGNIENSRIMSEVEDKVFKFGVNFVAVSDAMVKHFIKKYKLSSDDKNWVVMPIFDSIAQGDIEKKSYEKEIVYAGGTQKWQNVDKMVDLINDTSGYKYTILTHQPEAFNEINEDKRERVVIKTVASDKVSSYYTKASLGFLLRDDTVLNRVACPTKLIEYMCNGVVPVVMSENIGDAKSLGYKYVQYDELITKKFDRDRLRKMAKNNMEVLRRLRDQASAGRIKLKKNTSKIIMSNNMNVVSKNAIYELLKINSDYEDKVHENWALKQANDGLRIANEDLQVQMKRYDKIRNSFIYRMLSRAKRSFL